MFQMTFDVVDKNSKVISFNTDSVTVYNPKKEFVNGNKAKRLYWSCQCIRADLFFEDGMDYDDDGTCECMFEKKFIDKYSVNKKIDQSELNLDFMRKLIDGMGNYM